jgi:hypothetical protein
VPGRRLGAMGKAPFRTLPCPADRLPAVGRRVGANQRLIALRT